MMRSPTRLILLLAAVALAATACSGDADAVSGVASLQGQGTTTTTASVSGAASANETEAALLAFAACMREHGIDMADPTVDEDGNVQFGRFRDGQGPGEEAFDRETMQAARAACSGLLDGVTLAFRDRDDPELQDTLLAYAQCMRDNGYDMPDPDFSAEPGPGRGPFGQIDRTDPDFQAAQEACVDILGGFGPGRGPGGGPPPGGQG